MSDLPPLTFAVPLGAAALLAVLGSHLPRHVVYLVATLAALATTGIEFAQLIGSWPDGLVHWFGNWSVQHHFAVGIAFTVDPVNASLACVVGVLMVAALAYSWMAIPQVSHLYQVLMLVFLAGMSGFALSGDLFNIFVFFELMSVTGYGLCSFRQTSSTVLQGSLNFAIVNTVGAFFILMGIALIYGRTGALNLAQIAHSLAGHRPDGLVVVAFIFIIVGFLTKAGAVPFHFWLSDAYAVAAAPVGALYAGIMSDLGYHAIATVYSDAFAPAFAGSATSAFRDLLISVGVLTVIVGAVMCFLEADIKRQLAFLVISHGGIFLCGIGLLTGQALAGSTLYVAADAMMKGALFLAVGYIVVVLGASDELLLRGRGRGRSNVPVAVVFTLAALGLAALPGFGTWLSASLIESSATSVGFGWLPPVLAAGTAFTAATILRAGARVFLGWGAVKDPLLTSSQPDEPEEGEPHEEEQRRLSLWALVPATALLAIGFGLSFAPEVANYAISAGRTFLNTASYVGEILRSLHPATPVRLPAYSPNAGAWAYGAATTCASIVLALAGLYWQRLPARIHRRTVEMIEGPVTFVKALHSGRVGDMVTWLAAGAVALCATAALSFR